MLGHSPPASKRAGEQQQDVAEEVGAVAATGQNQQHGQVAEGTVTSRGTRKPTEHLHRQDVLEQDGQEEAQRQQRVDGRLRLAPPNRVTIASAEMRKM